MKKENNRFIKWGLKMFKNISKTTITINIIALLAIFYDVLVIFKRSTGLFGADYLFGIYFLLIIYSVCFIHLFFYKNISDKLKVTTLDLLPILFFVLIASIIQETSIKIILEDIVSFTLPFYLIGGIVIFVANFVISLIYSKIKRRWKK